MKPKTYRKEIRVIGIDDAPFDKHTNSNGLLVGTIHRGGAYLDGVLSTKVRVDGTNATHKISEMINSSKFKQHLRCIFLNGIAVAGFNIIDIARLNKNTGIPVMVVIRNYPRYKTIYAALTKMGKPQRQKLIDKAPRPVKIHRVYVQLAGIDEQRAKHLLELTCTRANVPEPLRTAHLIARGVTWGESKGGA